MPWQESFAFLPILWYVPLTLIEFSRLATFHSLEDTSEDYHNAQAASQLTLVRCFADDSFILERPDRTRRAKGTEAYTKPYGATSLS